MPPTKQFSNKELSELLRNVAAVYLLKNENRFRIIAYEKAADTVEQLGRELYDIWKEGRDIKLPGIGSAIKSHLDELFEKGESAYFDEVFEGFPSSVFVLMRIPGLGPKKAFKLVQALELVNPDTVVDDLKKAAEAGKIEHMESFGSKSQQDILESITLYQRKDRSDSRMPLPIAFSEAQKLITHLKKHPKVGRVEALGSLRRMVPTIGDVDIAVIAEEKDYADIIEHFIGYPDKISVDNAGKNKSSIIVPPNLRIDLRLQEEDSFGSMLQYFTGSKAHNIKLREYALKKGYSLSEWGIKKVTPAVAVNEDGDVPPSSKSKAESYDLKFKDEESFYGFLGLQYPEPEIREGTKEVELAVKKQLPNLVKLGDIKGDFHMHSSYAGYQSSHDLGTHSYEELVQKGISLGYNYIGFADHNPKITDIPAAQIIREMKERKEYIDQLFSTSKSPKLKYFIGLECDILPSGELAIPVEAIEYVDYLVVSVHSSMQMNIDKMTERVLKGLSYPKVKIFGHPTGRLLGKRDGYELHWDKIFEEVLKRDIALEVNSWPQRLDLPDILVKEGKERGCKFFIDTDAHAVEHMDNMFYGVSVARRGWLEKKDVVNTWEEKDVEAWLLK